MRLIFQIAQRYLISKKSRNAINIISFISLGGFCAGTFALVIVLSTMNGFEKLIVSIYEKFDPDFKIEASVGKTFPLDSNIIYSLSKIQGVASIQPVLEDNVVLRHADNQHVCIAKGVLPEYWNASGMNQYISNGNMVSKSDTIPFGILGAGVSYSLNINTNNPYSQITFYTPKRGNFNTTDPNAINIMSLKPSGEITMDEYINYKYVFVPLSFSQELFDRQNYISAIEILLQAKQNPATIKSEIQNIIGNKSFTVKNRLEQQKALYKMFKIEKLASYAILSFILLIAAFNMIGSLTMLVLEKKKDISTLHAMGASAGSIRKIFLIEGVLISVAGAVTGILLGIIACFLQQKYGFVKIEGALVQSYPVVLKVGDIVLIFGTAIALGILTSLYPSYKATMHLQQ